MTNTLMEMLPPYDWSDVARKSDLLALRSELSEFHAEVNGRFSVIEHDINRINRTLGWMIGGMLTIGTGIIVMLIQLSVQVARLQ